MTEEQLSNKFRNLGFIAACLVVFIHLGALGDDCAESSLWFYRVFTNGVCRVAVPFFFVSSGYWLAKKISFKQKLGGGYRNVLTKRIRTLVVPFFLWSAIFLCFAKGMQFASNCVAHRALMQDIWHGYGEAMIWFGIDVTVFPYYVPLWYIRALLILVLLSPVFIWTMRKCWWLTLTALMVYSFYPCHWFQLDWGPFYFTLGIWLTTQLGSDVLSFCFKYVPGGEWAKWLTSSAFPIYLMHWMVLCVYSILIPDSWSFASWYGLLLKGMAGILGALATTVFLRKIFPKASEILFGGR